jgi:phosphinothricin acetyltransferase
MDDDAVAIRAARPENAADLLAIYGPFVETTAVTFETEVPTVEDFADRIAKSLDGWSWLVAETPQGIAGYAYGTRWRDRPAYSRTVETSAYLDPRFHRRGIGRALYGALLADLAAKGHRMAVAGIALPNAASVALHRGLGFEPVGVFRAVGWKFGAWHDVAWLQRGLG